MKLLSDVPLREPAGDERKDALGFDEYSVALAESIRGADGPFTIGVFGGWGCGKTSLLRTVQRKLEGSPDVATVWFNAWQYENEAHPLIPLVRLLIEATEGDESSEKASGGLLQRLGSGLRGVLGSLKLKAEFGVPLVGKVSIESDVAKGREFETGLNEQSRAPRSELQTLPSAVFEALSKASKEPTDGKVVVFVDDLDRCTPPKALTVLESIKLVLAHPGFVFVLGVANRVIESYMDHRFSSEFGIEGVEGEKYLHKLVQLQFHVPPHDQRMPTFVSGLLDQVGGETKDRLQGLEEVIEVAAQRNPRTGVRFVNQLLLDNRIKDLMAAKAAKPANAGADPVELPFFAITRALQATWSDTYRTLMRSVPLCEAMADWTDDNLAISDVLPGSSDRGEPDITKDMAARLLKEPDLKKLLFSRHGRAWLRDPAKRVTASSFILSHGAGSMFAGHDRAVQFDAFLSYRMSDQDKVRRVARVLTNAGLRVIWDQALPPGANWRESLDRSLVRSRSLIFFVGRDTPDSEWQRRELEMAAAVAARHLDFRLFPILLPDGDPDRMADAARHRIWVDLRDFPGDSELGIRLRPLLRELGPIGS